MSEQLIFGEYLKSPEQINLALSNLDKNSTQGLTFEERFKQFEEDLKIVNGDGLPITGIVLEGPISRARIHDSQWKNANHVSEIGVNVQSNQGRAHSKGYHIFYGANSKETAACEVLQNHRTGLLDITIGEWVKPQPVSIVNFVDGSDEIFRKIPFVHSKHKEYLVEWPELEKESAILLMDYFKNKFKEPSSIELYNITNVLAGMCFSLQELEGIGYGSTSNDFRGFNIALRHYNDLQCSKVERWRIFKLDNVLLSWQKMKEGVIASDGRITWP